MGRRSCVTPQFERFLLFFFDTFDCSGLEMYNMLLLTLLNIAAVGGSAGGTGVPCEYWLCEESASGPYSKLNVSSLGLEVYVYTRHGVHAF